ncbi:DUF6384 family protein [Ahniella affigens]|nr:DUF6384 family protein [Ahniella affigens]
MSTSQNLPSPHQPNTSDAKLDDLMLAMDVVDTLRHEQELIHRELNDDARDAAFVARIREIYAAQGIAVSEDIIRQGVEALKQDRFSYQPPPRTFSVRLAEFYVDRWRWFKRGLITGTVLGALWLVAALPGQIAESFATRNFNQAVAEVEDGLSQHQAVIESFAEQASALNPERAPIAGAAITQIKLDSSAAIQALRADSTQIASLAAIDADAFQADRDAAARQLEAEQTRLASFKKRIDEVRYALVRGERLLGLDQQYQTAGALLAGVSLGADASQQLDASRQSIEAALRAGDVERAQASVQKFRQAAQQVDLSYELRIVNRPGVQSGIRRRENSQQEGRSYYLVVEAVDADGQVLSIPVINEETQQVNDVRIFAVRVDESEYHRVREDKQDNGLIDQPIVGTKARGDLEPTYQVKVVGGTITKW